MYRTIAQFSFLLKKSFAWEEKFKDLAQANSKFWCSLFIIMGHFLTPGYNGLSNQLQWNLFLIKIAFCRTFKLKGTLVPGTVISKVICGIFVKSMKLVNYRKLIIRISPITQLKRHIIFIWDFTNWTLVCLFVKNLSVSYIQFVISQIAQMCAEKSLSINDNKTLKYFVLHPELSRWVNVVDHTFMRSVVHHPDLIMV